MHSAAVALTCLACLGHGCRVQLPGAESQQLQTDRRTGAPMRLTVLARLLLALDNPASALQVAGLRHNPRGAKILAPTGHSSRLPPKRCADVVMSTATAPDWTELRRMIDKVVQDQGLDLHEAGRRGLREVADGPASSQAEKRLFGTDSDKVRVKFYRDNHAWCPYCHKVWMLLEEKQIPYQVEKVSMNCYGTKSASFLAKTPAGLLPAIEIDGKFMTESSEIMVEIEKQFRDQKPMAPPGTNEMLRLERRLFGAWLSWLRNPFGGDGTDFTQAMDATEQALKQSGGPFFLGADISLADCVFASSLERIAASLLYYKGLKIRNTKRWPRVEAWFREMEKRESYLASRSDYHTHVHDLPPQIGGCSVAKNPEQQAAAAEIDGTDGRSWNLPLPPLTVDSLEPGIENPLLDRLEAASALVKCHKGILKSSNANAAAALAFQAVAQALVEGVDELQKSSKALKPGDRSASAAKSLRYTRDRICVPRDMSFAAARQLRAHLNWAADIIDPRPKWDGTPLPTLNRRDTDPKTFGAPSTAGILSYVLNPWILVGLLLLNNLQDILPKVGLGEFSDL